MKKTNTFKRLNHNVKGIGNQGDSKTMRSNRTKLNFPIFINGLL